MLEYLNSFFEAPIFKGLNIDGSIVVQFFLVVVMWLVLKVLFFNKLKDVLLTREKHTVGSANEAEAILQKVKILEEKYKDEINLAHLKSQNESLRIKDEVSKREEQRFKSAEERAYLDSKILSEKLKEEFNRQAAEENKLSDDFSQRLLNKVIG